MGNNSLLLLLLIRSKEQRESRIITEQENTQNSKELEEITDVEITNILQTIEDNRSRLI